MNWIDRFNNAVLYIEEHLDVKIEYEHLAKIADCPMYHFQKTFLYMSGIPLNEYIRKRRMSLAAVDLQKQDSKIIEVALKYGYQSPTAFNRAFKSVHGVAPSQIRKKNVIIKAYPVLQFNLNIKGKELVNYRIEKKDSFQILGKSCHLSKELQSNFEQIPKEWETAYQQKELNTLLTLNDQKPNALLGVCVHNENDWRYLIAVSSTKAYKHFVSYTIPEATWAIFRGQGTNASLQELERRIILEWLPTSGYVYANIPDIEVYIKADPKDMIFEYWLPVVSKEKENDDECF